MAKITKAVDVAMFNIGMSELILILVIALVVFGPGKLPEVGKAQMQETLECLNSKNAH